MDLARLAWCLLSPKGRLSRQEFVLAFLLLVTAIAAAFRIAMLLTPDTGNALHAAASSDPRNEAIGFVAIASLWPLLAVAWKRLHDIGWPGFLALPGMVGALGLTASEPLTGLGATAVMLFFLAVWQGQAGANQYGPPPPAKPA